jgi:hypothetical protein
MVLSLYIHRGKDDGKGTPGEMTVLIESEVRHLCFTLEPSASAKFPKIPCGQYRAEIVFSPRFQTQLLRLSGVPGREYIEIHPGNKPEDTEGCTLVGETQGTDWVGSSRLAFLELMSFIRNYDPDSIFVFYSEVN